MRRLLLTCLLILTCCSTAFANRVKVRIFSNVTLECVYVSFDLGEYNLYANDTNLLESMLGEGMSVELLKVKDSISVSING